MSSLSTAQRQVLATAAGRADGAVLPFSDGLAVRGRARQRTLEALLKRGLIAERPAKGGDPTWSGTGPQQGTALEITPSGRALVESTDQKPPAQKDQSLEPAAARTDAKVPDPDVGSKQRSAVRAGTKQALLIELLRRPDGATIAEIQQATGWQPHTARSAITGLRKKRFAVGRLSRENGTRAYHVSG